MAEYKVRVRRLMASTILEVIIAMVIIMLVFGIAMMIFTNVTRSSISAQRIYAQAVLNQTAQAIEKTSIDTGHVSFSSGDLKIDQAVTPYNSNKNLLEIDLVAYDANQKKITELHTVILNNHE